MIGLITITAGGRAAAERLAAVLPYAHIYDGPAASALPLAFAECDAIISFLAVGATVRIAAPLITGKYEDPGIVCVDEALRFAIPVLGGHAGGANVLARRVAGILGGTAVITTAAEAAGSVGLDEFGADLGFVVEPGSDMAPVGAAILSGERVTLTMEHQWPVPPLPRSVVRTDRPEPGVPAIIVTDEEPAVAADLRAGPRVIYRPPSLVVGAGASTSVSADEVSALIDQALAAAGLSPRSVRWLATADIKAREPGLLTVAADRGWQVVTVPPAQLARVQVPTPSEIVRAAVGTPSVAEAAALFVASGCAAPGNPAGPGPAGAGGTEAGRTGAGAAEAGGTGAGRTGAGAADAGVTGAGRTDSAAPDDGLAHDAWADIAGGAMLVVTKLASARATVAVARRRPRGCLALIGLGPGARDLMTPRAVAGLRRASVVVGLDQYVRQIDDLLTPGVEIIASRLGEERQRAAAAVAEALAGRAVALISSGDAGVYAMASPALELADGRIDVTGVPGVTAALAAGAVLGAPLGHDHALISLSDLHTQWQVIERRVRAVAEADLVTCFYNPASRTRNWQLGRALAIVAEHRPPGTPVGWVRDVSRPGERAGISTLAGFDPAAADMHTLIVVGSSATTVVAGRMVTPREYRWAGQ